MVRLFFHCLLALTPWWVKNPIYRSAFGYQIGRRVRIGFSPVIVQRCRIEDDVRIGHLNLFWRTKELVIEDHVRIGHLNIFRGGDSIHIGRYAEIFRANVVNSIPEPDAETEVEQVFRLGAGSVITTSHWIDFTDKVTIGCRSILGGRNSSLWTHSRQWTRPISIGSYVYLGSEVRMAPGAEVPSRSVVALGSIVINVVQEGECLIAGNPARSVKALDEHGLRLLRKKTRPDLPDHLDSDGFEAREAALSTP
jgi:acetyltransferase-like isoleucine patch superfamily enzyme